MDWLFMAFFANGLCEERVYCDANGICCKQAPKFNTRSRDANLNTPRHMPGLALRCYKHAFSQTDSGLCLYPVAKVIQVEPRQMNENQLRYPILFSS